MLTACGIETPNTKNWLSVVVVSCNSAYRLRYWNNISVYVLFTKFLLQQCLPLAVLKHSLHQGEEDWTRWFVATVLTACGIETPEEDFAPEGVYFRCNSAYRLRYWNLKERYNKLGKEIELLQQCLPLAVLKLTKKISPLLYVSSCNSAYRLRYWN